MAEVLGVWEMQINSYFWFSNNFSFISETNIDLFELSLSLLELEELSSLKFRFLLAFYLFHVEREKRDTSMTNKTRT